MANYTTKTLTVQALQWTGSYADLPTMFAFMLQQPAYTGPVDNVGYDPAANTLTIPAASGPVTAQPNDWVLIYADGSYDVCAAAVFSTFYQPSS